MSPVELRTDRLALRQWRATDLDSWAALNADPAVMEFIGPPMRRDHAAIWLGYNQGRLDLRGWGLWAVERLDTGEFIGFCGLNPPTFEAAFTPCVEVGWRLARAHWGQGFAPEAARACLRHGFEVLGLDEIVSFTVVGNVKSRRVMEKLGMVHDADADFDHPNVPADSHLRRHVLYRLAAADWRADS